MTNRILLLLSFPVILVCGCVSGHGSRWPGENWETHPDSTRLLHRETLEDMYGEIEKRGLAVTSIIIIHDGYILEEEYPGELRRDEITALFSASKSVNSLITGIAIEEGLLSGTGEHVYAFFPEYPVPEAVGTEELPTIYNILTMTCGFDWDERRYSYDDPRNIYNRWKSDDDRVGFILELERTCPPGETFNYNTAASHLIPAIIQRVSGEPALDFARSRLFTPLGIPEDRIFWPTDTRGINRGGGLHLSPGDMARIGYLILRKGNWKGKQLVPEKWIEESLTGFIRVGYGLDFGYHWWIHHYRGTDIYSAEGYGGQRIYIVPDRDLVVVMTGELQASEDIPFRLLTEYILPALIRPE